MPYDYKKECKEFYQPSKKPSLVEVPAMNYVAVHGKGDPNEPDGDYQHALELLYGISFTIKMAPKAGVDLDGYFAYVVPPLEGFWSLPGSEGFDPARKAEFSWISCIRLPDFVTPDVFSRVCETVAAKRPALADALASGALRLVRFSEGPCAQVMHVGPYDDEPVTIAALTAFTAEKNLVTDIAEGGESPEGHAATRAFDTEAVLASLCADGAVPSVRLHHEIYLGDPRKTSPEKLRTVIRHPVRER